MRVLRRTAGSELSFAAAFSFGAAGRLVSTLCTFPLLRAKIMAMSDQGTQQPSTPDWQPEHSFCQRPVRAFMCVRVLRLHPRACCVDTVGSHLGVLGCLRETWRRTGFVGLYQGLPPELLRAIAFQAISKFGPSLTMSPFQPSVPPRLLDSLRVSNREFPLALTLPQ